VLRISSIGKGYPTVDPFDLMHFVRIPLAVLTAAEGIEGNVTATVRSVFDQISALQSERDIIDAVLATHLPGAGASQAAEGAASQFVVRRAGLGASFDLRMSTHFVHPFAAAALAQTRTWHTVKIGRLCSLPIRLGTSPEQDAQPSSSEAEFFYLSSAAMAQERLNESELVGISEEFYRQKADRFGTRCGDVFVRRSGASLGKVLFLDSGLPCIFSDFMMRLRFHDLGVARFAAYWMRSSAFQALVNANAVVGKGPRNIYPYQIATMPMPDPHRYDAYAVVGSVEQQLADNHRVMERARDRLSELGLLLSEQVGFRELECLLPPLPNYTWRHK
jgi:hypothetical protein